MLLLLIIFLFKLYVVFFLFRFMLGIIVMFVIEICLFLNKDISVGL